MGWFSKLLGLDDMAEGLDDYSARAAAETARQEAEMKRQAEMKANSEVVAASRGGRASNILTGGRGDTSAPVLGKASQTLAGMPAAPAPMDDGSEDEATKRLKMR